MNILDLSICLAILVGGGYNVVTSAHSASSHRFLVLGLVLNTIEAGVAVCGSLWYEGAFDRSCLSGIARAKLGS